MLVPPANPGNRSSFLQYSGDCIEPWDGPAALAFTDGHQVGAILDRNGLRPCRFALSTIPAWLSPAPRRASSTWTLTASFTAAASAPAR